MQTLVSAWLDNGLTGLALWYTKRHIALCPQCQSSLPFLRALRERLRSVGAADEGLAADRWSQVEAAWEQAEPQ